MPLHTKTESNPGSKQVSPSFYRAWRSRFAFFIVEKVLASISPQRLADMVVRVIDKQGLQPHSLAIFDEIFKRAPDQAAERLVKELPELIERELVKSVPRFAFRQECYSQEGEDLVLARLFAGKRDGFYVDVGAHHPIRFSNTYLLYRLGWQGINIDATPNSMDEFRRFRPRDINIECLVSSDEASRTFYLLTEPALNTSSQELARQRGVEDSRYQVTGTAVLRPRTLAAILEAHVPPGRSIDLLNIDVEGLDLDVLQSNDWERYHPDLVLIELLRGSSIAAQQHEITQYLGARGYKIVSRFFNSVLFQTGE